MDQYPICNKCRYNSYSKNSYPCASCKRTNYYRCFTPAVNEYIGQCPLCGTPFNEGDISISKDGNLGPSSVLKCTCHNKSCRRVSIYKIGTYLKAKRD